MRFAGRTILIAGAGSGIGRATANLLSEEGAGELVLLDQHAGTVGNLQVSCAQRIQVGDVSDETTWDCVCLDLGEIDHAVVNAGIAAASPIAELPFSEWRRILAVNLDGAFLTLRTALRAIRDEGSIVVVASSAGIKPEAGIAAYAASKAGVIQLARVAAKEAAHRGIRVNVIAPGGVETPIWNDMPAFAKRTQEVGRENAFREMAALATPLGRYAKPEEIAGQIAFLLSDDCKTVSGSVFVSDGGYTL